MRSGIERGAERNVHERDTQSCSEFFSVVYRLRHFLAIFRLTFRWIYLHVFLDFVYKTQPDDHYRGTKHRNSDPENFKISLKYNLKIYYSKIKFKCSEITCVKSALSLRNKQLSATTSTRPALQFMVTYNFFWKCF